MTPLALSIAKELMISEKDRVFSKNDHAFVLENLPRIHMFECTALLPLMESLEKDPDIKFLSEASGELMFLPAPHTWLEMETFSKDRRKFRQALYTREFSIEEDFYKERNIDPTLQLALLSIVQEKSAYPAILFPLGISRMDLATGSGGVRMFGTVFEDIIAERGGMSVEKIRSIYLNHIYILLAAVNTPRIFGRKSHAPHAGFQRDLARSRGTVGKFPLRPWTEIKMEVRPPSYLGEGDVGGESKEAILSGKKALHFVRQHLRIVRGRFVLVTAHWRGDPALGIIRSKYKVKGNQEMQS